MDNNYVKGLVDTDSYNLLITGDPVGDGSGKMTSSISIGGNGDIFGIKLTKDSSNNVFIDHRGDTLAFRHEDESSGTITSLMELVNDSSLTDAISYGLSISGRVKASAYHAGSIDTRTPTESGVYMGMGDDNIGYFNVNKGDGVGGFTFSTYSANGTLLQTNMKLLDSGDIQAPYYKSTDNEHDIEDVAYMGIDADGNLVRHYMANARMRGLEGRISMVENNLEGDVPEKVNEIVERLNDVSFFSENILPMEYTPNQSNLLNATTSDITLIKDSSYTGTSITPVVGTGGSGTYTYTLAVSPSLPSGLSFSTSTGAITGTPTVVLLNGASYTVTVDDGDTTISKTFTLTINYPAVDATTSDITLIKDTSYTGTTITPVVGTGGSGTYTYTLAVSPSLPSGLSFSTSTGAITGTPTSLLLNGASYTVTVNDGYTTSSKTFTLTVYPTLVATQTQESSTLTKGTVVSSFIPVTGSGGSQTYTYSISPSLPTGLSFNTSTGAITGTPTVSASLTTYTVTVTDSNTSIYSSNTFTLQINSPPLSTNLNNSSISVKSGIDSLNYYPVTGLNGSGSYTYSISPDLSFTYLSFDTSTGRLYGICNAVLNNYQFTITVNDGNTTDSKSFSLTSHFYGEWMQIQMPNPIVLYKFQMGTTSRYSPTNYSLTTGSICECALLGSNNGNDWVYITNSPTGQASVIITLTYTPQAYSYYRLVILSKGGVTPKLSNFIWRPFNINILSFFDSSNNMYPSVPLSSDSTTLSDGTYITSTSATSYWMNFDNRTITNQSGTYNVYSMPTASNEFIIDHGGDYSNTSNIAYSVLRYEGSKYT